MTKKDAPPEPEPEIDEPNPDNPDEPEPEPGEEIDLDKLIEEKATAIAERIIGERLPKAEPSTPAPAATSSSSATPSSGGSEDIERRVEKVLEERGLRERVAKLEEPPPPKERKGLAKILWG